MKTTIALSPLRSRLSRGVWRVADPKITLASLASMLLGGAFAVAGGPIDGGSLFLTVFGIFFIEVAKNASGEIFDFDSGADLLLRPEEHSPFSGGKRLLVDALMNRKEAAVLAAITYALGIGAGLWIAFAHEPRVLLFGLAGVALAYFYHAPPIKLSYRGFGELAVALSYGPLITAGTYLVQRHTLDRDILLASIPLGLSIAAFLFINEFPDMRADALAKKRTLVVRLGWARAQTAYVVLLGVSFACLASLPLLGAPVGVLLGFLGLPHAIRAAARMLRHPSTVAEIVPLQGWTLLSFLLLSLGMSIGALIA
jgi:1,4-dihydroxy-2-naphthoate polyprenyltransferase